MLILNLLGVRPYLSEYGINLSSLAIFSVIWGMGVAFISLGMSRIIAKKLMGVQLVDPNISDQKMKKIIEIVYTTSRKAGLKKFPEVGVYKSEEVNAFATGPTSDRALIAISSGLLSKLNQEEIEGVIGHEISHISNGDMVTMTLLQGVINAFVIFLSQLIAFVLSSVIGQRKSRSGASLGIFILTQWVFQFVFMIFGSILMAWYSRRRELSADYDGAKLSSFQKMIAALKSLQHHEKFVDRSAQPQSQLLKISDSSSGLLKLFSSHPSLELRISRLEIELVGESKAA